MILLTKFQVLTWKSMNFNYFLLFMFFKNLNLTNLNIYLKTGRNISFRNTEEKISCRSTEILKNE